MRLTGPAFASILLASALVVAAEPLRTPPPTEPLTVEEGLRQVVDDALAANLELSAGTASVQQRLAALDQARARYLPVLDLAARYSVADGGRTIDFPVGDLLNPVYATLDELLVAAGQPARFPRVQNEQIELLRSREQETKLVLLQPVYEPRLGPTLEASRQDLNRAEANLAALRARVIRDTRQAYYRWLAAGQALLVIEVTRDLAQANLDANESLYRNGRITRDLVFRAEADVLENLGRGNPRVYYNIFPEETKANMAEVFAELHAYEPRRSPRLYEDLRGVFNEYPAAQIQVEAYQNGPPIDSPIEVAIVGPDLEQLRELAAEAELVIAGTPGTRDVDNPVRRLRTDLDLNIDAQKAALLGVAPVEADRTVRAAVAGLGVGKFREPDGDEYDITLRLPMQGRPTLEALDLIEVASATGRPVPLRQIAAPGFSAAASLVRRRDREREVLLSAYPAAGYNTGKVTKAVFERLRAMELPPGYSLRAGGEVEARAETLSGVGTAALVAVFGILAVLVLEFGSFRSMLIVAGVVPLGVAGALLALLVTGYTLSFTATIGLVALIGIQIKNSILLVDFANQQRSQGMSLDEAVVRTGEIRILSILLTSATAVGGLLPLAIQGSGLYSPLAIVIIGGLVSSTLLGGIVTPVMYRMLPPEIVAERKGERG